MQIKIEHREETRNSALGRTTKDYFVDFTVVLSEEEKAIIKDRQMQKEGFNIGAAIRSTAEGGDANTTFYRVGGIILIVIGIATASSLGPLSGMMIIGGGVAVVMSFLKKRQADTALYGQTISLRRLMENPKFTVYVSDPGIGKIVTDEVTEKLTGLKNYIKLTVEVPETKIIDI